MQSHLFFLLFFCLLLSFLKKYLFLRTLKKVLKFSGHRLENIVSSGCHLSFNLARRDTLLCRNYVILWNKGTDLFFYGYLLCFLRLLESFPAEIIKIFSYYF